MSTPQLSYSLLLQNSSNNSTTYLDAGEAATLTLLVSNPGAGAVTLNSLTLNVSLGPNATDLAMAGDITPVVPAGWTANGLILTPVGGSVSVGFSEGLTFQFTLTVNSEVGTTQISVTEVTTPNGTAYPTPWQVAKMSTNFELTDLTASPVQIAPGGTVTLTWTGTPGQVYYVNYFGGPADGVPVTAPPSGSVSWTSPAIETTSSNVAFTVSATVQGVTAEASTTVTVNVPQILTFPPPPGIWTYLVPVTLTWTTVNADYCEVYANGSLIDSKAPANTPPDGYNITPDSLTTTYTLYACGGSGGAQSAPQSVMVNVQLWTAGATLDLSDAGPLNSLALTNDCATLYVAGSSSVTQINTDGMSVNASANLPVVPLWQGGGNLQMTGLALSSDESLLYIGCAAYSTANLQNPPQPAFGTPMSTFNEYSSIQFALNPGATVAYTFQPTTNPYNQPCFWVGQFPFPFNFNNGESVQSGLVDRLSALQFSPDGSTMYTLMPPSEVSSSLWEIGTSPISYGSQVNGVNPALPSIALSPDGKTLYSCATGAGSGPVAIRPLAIPGYGGGSAIPIYTPPAGATAGIACLATAPTGLLFVAVMVSGLTGPGSGPVGNGLNVFVFNPYSKVVSFICNNPDATFSPTWQAMPAAAGATGFYLAAGSMIFQFTLATGSGQTDTGKATTPAARAVARESVISERKSGF